MIAFWLIVVGAIAFFCGVLIGAYRNNSPDLPPRPSIPQGDPDDMRAADWWKTGEPCPYGEPER